MLRDEFLFEYEVKGITKSIIVKDKGNDASWDILDNTRKFLRERYLNVRVYRRARILFYRSKWERFYSIDDLRKDDE